MRKLLAGAGIAALLAGTAVAQDMPPPGPPVDMALPTRAEVEAAVPARFAEMDANKDGVVKRAEFDAFRTARNEEAETRMKDRRDRAFARLDANKDGTLSKPEFETPPPGGPRRGAGGMRMVGIGGARWFDRADADHDGKVTLPEARAAALASYDRLDADHDGRIGPDEMKAMGPRGPGRGGDGPPPR